MGKQPIIKEVADQIGFFLSALSDYLLIYFPVSQAPPVGCYDVHSGKQGGGLGFGKGKRFADLKGQLFTSRNS